MESYALRVALPLQTPGWGIPVVRRGIDWETIVIVSGLSVLLIRGTISDPEAGYLLPRATLTVRTPGWRFHIVRGGI